MIEHPRDDAHLVAFPHAGPVAYVSDANFLGGSPIGRQKIAGTLAFQHRPLEGISWMSPLTLELFSGVGTVWNETNGGVGDFLEARINALEADAGVGLGYNVAELRPLERWIDQSSVLQGLRIESKFPLWVSDPASIGDDSELAFRWLIGVRVQR